MLPTMSVERCRQCDDSGWGTCIGEGTCVIGDDFDEVAAKISKADAVVFANPVYFSDLSESMRAFLDRLRRISWNRPGQAGTGGKPALGICVAGGSGNGAPECCWRLEQFLTRCGFDVVDMVPVKRQNLDMKTQTLEIAGRWLVSSGT
jgi:multimeric flavodoxin WrbA